MPAALARGDVDAVSIWEPAAEQSARALGSDAVILHGPDYRERFNLNTTATILASRLEQTLSKERASPSSPIARSPAKTGPKHQAMVKVLGGKAVAPSQPEPRRRGKGKKGLPPHPWKGPG